MLLEIKLLSNGIKYKKPTFISFQAKQHLNFLLKLTKITKAEKK